MTNKSQPILSKVLHVSYKDSPFETDDVDVFKANHFNPSLSSAISKLHFVRGSFQRINLRHISLQSLVVDVTQI